MVELFRKPSGGVAVKDAIRIVRAYRPELRDEQIRWFGWRLRDDSDARFVGIGHDVDEELGLAQARGWVVDVISEHVVWERAITGEKDVPRSLGQFIKAK
jgi:hypothetical protein